MAGHQLSPDAFEKAVDFIAQVTHEANRAYCIDLGDFSPPHWGDAPEWQQDSVRAGVRGILNGVITKPEESHESWLEDKRAHGWTYGPVKNPVAKEHPCFVPYDQLPASQRKKDTIFFGIVRALEGALSE